MGGRDGFSSRVLEMFQKKTEAVVAPNGEGAKAIASSVLCELHPDSEREECGRSQARRQAVCCLGPVGVPAGRPQALTRLNRLPHRLKIHK